MSARTMPRQHHCPTCHSEHDMDAERRAQEMEAEALFWRRQLGRHPDPLRVFIDGDPEKGLRPIGEIGAEMLSSPPPQARPGSSNQGDE